MILFTITSSLYAFQIETNIELNLPIYEWLFSWEMPILGVNHMGFRCWFCCILCALIIELHARYD